jgi:hypothetical protein
LSCRRVEEITYKSLPIRIYALSATFSYVYRFQRAFVMAARSEWSGPISGCYLTSHAVYSLRSGACGCMIWSYLGGNVCKYLIELPGRIARRGKEPIPLFTIVNTCALVAASKLMIFQQVITSLDSSRKSIGSHATLYFSESP